jgi:1-acyl-sn-glycerol-3-phosphate acyltransferase
MAAGHGVLITPNHSSHADCYVLFHALEQLPLPPQVMTAWQVFVMLGWLQRLIYRQHGCFSIDREANDITSFRWAVRVLEQSSQPLVIFPEGEVYHLNDRVTPLRDGTPHVALVAARLAPRPVECFPCAIKYFYVTDPTPELTPVLEQIERRVELPPAESMPLEGRVERLFQRAVEVREQQVLGHTRRGPLQPRIDRLADEVLCGVEQRYALPAEAGRSEAGRFVPLRVKQVRRAIIERCASLAPTDPARQQLHADLEAAFLATQLYSYRVDYVRERPTIERIAETIDKLEEDFLELRTARVRGRRRATIHFGPSIVLQPEEVRQEDRQQAAPVLGESLRRGIQELLDAASRPSADSVRVTTKPSASIIR